MPDAKNLLIVFDLVSTLTDAGPRYVHAFVDSCKQYNYPVPDTDEVMDMLGNKNLKQIITHFVGDLDDQTEKKFMNTCNDSCDAMLFKDDWKESLFPNVKETLEKLHLTGYRLGIYTGTRENALQDQIKYHGIDHLFSPTYIRGKDNERDAGVSIKELKSKQLLSLVEQHRRDCKQEDAPVLVIGDSATDVESAAEHGYYFIGFAETERKKAKLLESDVKTLMTDFSDLPYLLKMVKNPDIVKKSDTCKRIFKATPPETLKAIGKCLKAIFSKTK